jgi:hypothetical protein
MCKPAPREIVAVLSNQIRVGMTCAMRARPADTPVEVQVLAPSPRVGNWKVRHLTGDQEGLEEWLPSRMLLLPLVVAAARPEG